MAPFRSRTLLESAKDLPCLVCGDASGTTVSAHVNSVALGKGIGIKAPDYYTAHLCQDCHDLYDGRKGHLTKEERDALWFRAFVGTVARWFNLGFVVVK